MEENSRLFTSEIMKVEVYNKSDSVASVADTTNVFDTENINTDKVPGIDEKYVRFGDDDDLPNKLIGLIGSDEVTAQNKLFNILTLYGQGLEYTDKKTNEKTKNGEINEWIRRQNLPMFFLEQATDMKHFFFAVCVIILNKQGNKINKIRHKEATYIRLQEANEKGIIENVYYGNFKNPTNNNFEKIPLLDMYDPLGDLYTRLGKEPNAKGSYQKPTNQRKFAIMVRFPTAGFQYYPTPYYTAIFRGGSYDEKRLISTGKRAKLRNQSSVKYQVEINNEYWENLINEERITDPIKIKERIQKEKENIKNFVAGIENSGKVWITGYYMGVDGKENHMVKIVNIEGQKEGGDWNEDLQATANTVCYADNIHPNMVGAVPGKTQSNNSGSDKRELFTMKQSLEKAFKDLLLQTQHLCIDFNGWEKIVEPKIPIMLLTTLDENTDAKITNND